MKREDEKDNREQVFPTRFSLGQAVLWIASVALIYFASARISLSLLFQPEGIAAIWLPSGIFLSAILLSQRELRPWLTGTLFITDLIAEILAGTPFLVSAVYALALTGDAVLSCWLLFRFVGESITFGRARDVVGWLVLSVLCSNALMGLVLVQAFELLPGTHSFSISWLRWVASVGLGNLLMTPLILTWAVVARTRRRIWNRQKVLEGVALFIPLALLTIFLSSRLSVHLLFAAFLPFLTFPFLLWATFRFGVRGVATALFVVATMTLLIVASGRVPSLPQVPNIFDGVTIVQLFLAILAVPLLVLAAVENERKQAGEALQKSNALFEGITDQSPNPMWISDENGTLVRINQACCDLLNITAEEVVGKYNVLKDNLVEEQGFTPLMRTVFEEGRHVRFEMRYDSSRLKHLGLKGTSFVILNVNAFPIRDANGNVTNAVIQHIDITARKLAEEAIRESEGQFKTLFMSISEGFYISEIIYDDNGDPCDYRYLEVNPKFEQILGLSRDQIVGKRYKELVPVDTTQWLDNYCKVARTGVPLTYEFYSNEYCLYFETYAYQPAKGQVSVFVRDITERKHAGEEIKRSQDQLRALTRHLQGAIEEERSRIAREIHDDIGQLLTATKMDLALLAKEVGGIQEKRIQKKLSTEIEALIGLLDRGVQSIRRIVRDLRPELLGAMGLVAGIDWHAKEFEKRTGIRVFLDLPGAEPTLDKSQSLALFRVMQESLTNVARHAQASTVKIELKADPSILRLTITDNGKGIEEEARGRLLSVGLIGMRERMAELGGMFSIHGTPGEGTVVEVVLPKSDNRTQVTQPTSPTT
jgi:PAS domain S-box-containing protein